MHSPISPCWGGGKALRWERGLLSERALFWLSNAASPLTTFSPSPWWLHTFNRSPPYLASIDCTRLLSHATGVSLSMEIGGAELATIRRTRGTFDELIEDSI